MKNKVRVIQQKVEKAWNDVMFHLERISNSSTVHPTLYEIFSFDQPEPDLVNLNVGPMVVNVSERANRPTRVNLFIVVEGWLNLSVSDQNTTVQTNNFGTRVAYFRNKRCHLEHIFGAHYDMDENDSRHPIFHAQMDCRVSDSTHIYKYFSQNWEIKDKMNGVFRGVRIPTAQMDFFSVFTQICADHLVGTQPTQATADAFENIKSASNFLLGAGNKINYLNTPPASSCLRATHWYN